MSRTAQPQHASRCLVTGGAGFIGSNLAHRLACEGHQVTVLDTLARPGVDANLAWLKASHGDRTRCATCLKYPTAWMPISPALATWTAWRATPSTSAAGLRMR